MFNIKYGRVFKNIDVTDLVFRKCKKQNIIHIPKGDVVRGNIFTDPLVGIQKYVYITLIDEKSNIVEYMFDEYKDIYIDIEDNSKINTIIPEHVKTINKNLSIKLNKIHDYLFVNYGILKEEKQKQLLFCRYLMGYEKILQLNSKLSLDSLIIASILVNKENNLVVMEPNIKIANKLENNKKINNMNFHIENSILSNNVLILQNDCDNNVSIDEKEYYETNISNGVNENDYEDENEEENEDDVLVNNYEIKYCEETNVINWNDLNNKYQIDFDTLVIDNENLFFNILKSYPEMLQNIILIILIIESNELFETDEKKYIDNVLIENGFTEDYVEFGSRGSRKRNVYEVWKKNVN